MSLRNSRDTIGKRTCVFPVFLAQCLNQLFICHKSKDIMVESGRGVEREYYFIPLYERHMTNRMEEGLEMKRGM